MLYNIEFKIKSLNDKNKMYEFKWDGQHLRSQTETVQFDLEVKEKTENHNIVDLVLELSENTVIINTIAKVQNHEEKVYVELSTPLANSEMINITTKQGVTIGKN